MANLYKNFVWTFVHEVKVLCRTITRHQGVFTAVLQSTVTDPVDRATIAAMISAVVAGCAALDKYYPNIPA